MAALGSISTHPLYKQICELSVLVVDDDVHMRRVLRMIMSSIGLKNTYEASDGLEGFEVATRYNPNVIIVDWEMPMLTGTEFIKMVRNPGEFPTPDVPIIMLTAYADRSR